MLNSIGSKGRGWQGDLEMKVDDAAASIEF